MKDLFTDNTHGTFIMGLENLVFHITVSLDIFKTFFNALLKPIVFLPFPLSQVR